MKLVKDMKTGLKNQLMSLKQDIVKRDATKY